MNAFQIRPVQLPKKPFPAPFSLNPAGRASLSGEFSSASALPPEMPGSHSPTGSVPLAPGFSLVEVILALGLCSFALLSLVSLLPVSLDSARSALEISRASKAFQKVASELTHSKFATVAALAPTPYYFDYDGNASDEAEKYFTILATIAPSPITNQSSASLLRVHLEARTPRETNAGQATITICDMGY